MIENVQIRLNMSFHARRADDIANSRSDGSHSVILNLNNKITSEKATTAFTGTYPPKAPQPQFPVATSGHLIFEGYDSRK